MTSHARQKPLWKRIVESKEVQRFYAKHPDLSPNHSKEQTIAYAQDISDSRQAFAEMIQLVYDDLPAEHQRMAALYLDMAPADIARELGVPRVAVYQAIVRLKRCLRRLTKQHRDRSRSARAPRIDLDTTPEAVALRTLRFTLRNREEPAYLIMRDEEYIWVDSTGRPFLEEVQDLLFQTATRAVNDGFEVLDVEKI